MLRRTIAVVAFCLLCVAIYAGDYYVSSSGNDSSGNGSMEKPWRTIQFGLDQGALLSTDTVRVHVAAGTYQENIIVEETEEIYGGYNDSEIPWLRDWEQFGTRLEKASDDTYIVEALDGAVVDGFMIVGSNYSGIRARLDTVIANNTITDCRTGGIWGGRYVINNIVYGNGGQGISASFAQDNIVMWNGDVGIIATEAVGNISMFNFHGIQCKIARNNIVRCNRWAGIRAWPECVIEGNVIADNGPYGAICGLEWDYIIEGVIRENIITRCYSGIVFSKGNPEIYNNVIAGCGLGIASSSGWPKIRDCILWDNADDLVGEPWDIKYSLTGEGYPGEGNISVDPEFVGWGEFTLENPLYVDVNSTGDVEDGTAVHPYGSIWKGLAAYDFHLSVDSPCIGAGEGGVDMGAYPGVTSYSPVHSPSARIDVMPGTYHEYNLHPGNRVWLRAVEGPEVTIIEGTGDSYLTPRIFQLTDRAILDGFTINSASGGTYGVDCEHGSNDEGLRPVVMNCIIKNSGTGIVGRYGGSPAVVSCLVYYNNIAGIGLDVVSDVVNTIAWGNDMGIWVLNNAGPFRLRNCIFWGNETADDAVVESLYMKYCDTGGPGPVTDPTNFSEDPAFMGGGDFHLRWDSPCRNRGTEELAPVFDFEGRLHGQGKVVDVGAYEYEEGWVWNYDDGTTEGWQSASVPLAFAEPEFSWSDGGLLVRATSATDCFGYWLNAIKEIAYVEDSVYELRWETKRAVSGLNRYPVMRLRTNTGNLEESTTYVINNGGELTSGTEAAVYTLYLVRPEQFLEYPGQGYRKLLDAERLLLAFDMLNFDPAGDPAAEILLDNIEVSHSRFRKDWTVEEVTNCDFESGADGWTPSGEIEPFTAPQDSWTSGMLALQSTTNTNCFGFWQSQVVELPTTATQTLLRATFMVKSDEDAGASPLPIVRLRIMREDSSEAVVKTIEGTGTRSPGTEPREYTVCYWLAAGSEPHRIRLAFDLLNFNPEASATATLFLDNVKLETLSSPLL